MKIFLSKVLMSVVAVCLIPNSYAAWTEKTKIRELRAQANGIYVILENFTNTDVSINCENSGFWMPDDAQNYQVRTSFLISAFVSKQDIKISYYNCNGIYHEIGTVSLSP